MGEVRGTVERVDAPEVIGARIARDPSFLSQDRVLWEGGADYCENGFFGGRVCLCDEVGGPFKFDVSRLVDGGEDDLFVWFLSLVRCWN